VSVLVRASPFARFGSRTEWPSCSHRPASIVPCSAHPIASVAFATLQSPRPSTSGTGASRRLAWRTTRASSAGAAFTLHVSISDAPRRHHGHRLPAPDTGGQLARRTICKQTHALRWPAWP